LQQWKLQIVECVLLNEADSCQDEKNEYGGLVEWWWQGENQSTQEETHPITILSTTNLTWTGLGLNLGLFDELSWPYNFKLWLKQHWGVVQGVPDCCPFEDLVQESLPW